MKNKIKSPHWVAFIIANDKNKGKILSSFLAFWALNRYYARIAIEQMLSENSSYLDENGILIPFSILELHQCKPEDSNKYGEIYTKRFAEIIGADLSDVNSWFS